jgi:Galactosyltransferase
MTFLRTHVSLDNRGVGNDHLRMASGFPAARVHQEFQQRRRRIRGEQPSNTEGDTNSFSSAIVINTDKEPQTSVLPGLHNARPDKFNQDAGDLTEAELLANSTTNGQQQQQSEKKENINWWALLQKFEKNKNVQKIDRRDTGPRSEFVQHLYRIQDDLLAVANGTDTSVSVPPLPPIPNDWRDRLAKTPSDQPVHFATPILSPPTRILQNHSSTSSSSEVVLVVLVLSHQGSFIKRQAIRETWAKNHSAQVRFVVGQSDCAEFEQDLDGEVSDMNENAKDSSQQSSNQRSAAPRNNSMTMSCNEVDHNFLRLEQERYQDLLEIPMMESYASLPEKLLQAYHWVLQNVPHVQWIVKSDDDMFVRVANLQRYLKKYNSDVPMVVGEIIYHSSVRRDGKWAELEYPHDHYPYWPKGSAGHVISRAAAKFFSDMSPTLHRYQGEDTSIGIWLDEAQQSKQLEDVTYIHAKNMFESHGKNACAHPKYMIIGHDMHPDELLECQVNHTGELLENAWLDDPSEFADMIRQEMGPNGDAGLGWRPAIGYNRPPSALERTSSSFGYRAKLV